MEEAEVCILIQECLALREKYVFQERVHPWQKGSHELESIGIPKPNLDTMAEGASQVLIVMHSHGKLFYVNTYLKCCILKKQKTLL